MNEPAPAAPVEGQVPPAPPSRFAGARARFKGARRWAFEIAILVGVYFALSTWQERHLLRTRSTAPSFELAALDGTPVSLESLRGKRVVLHFFATWCGVCRMEPGALNAVQSGLGKDEVLYAIVQDSDDPERVRRYVTDQHIKYPVLLGTPEVLAAYRVGAFPTTYYVDSDGRIGNHAVGMTTRLAIRARLALLD